MSLPLAIAAIAFADLALIGVLAFVMTRGRLLTPHVSAAGAAIEAPRPVARRARYSGHATPARVTAAPVHG